MFRYFKSIAVMVMVVLTVFLLVLPLVLPPLPPPPLVLLFVPVFIMSLLVFLAFSPSKLPDTPSTSV
ncbi:hypothetical protein POPTR_006G037801v4 [Populus trichocarpa]|uniref:Transmembrane protein n=1 Tax=Populus trichocarpa TaxID=3694 RepID=A0A3N7GCD6_POPTR|nr:hypothetical protein BDE02_06G030600 [Populus trichocarpa]RQO91248.1 hypothetical protein POPTR_006G037801v4 [Populus trichocarpa]